MARYLPNGSLDTTFGDGGYARPIPTARHPGITTLVELPDGRIVTGSPTENRLAVFDAGGHLVDRVGLDLVGVDSLVGLPDGRIIAAGTFFSQPGLRVVGHIERGAATIEPWDLPAGLPELARATVSVDASGRVYDTLCSRIFNAPRCVVVALTPAGTLDTAYGAGGLLELPVAVGAGSPYCATDVAPDGYLVAACPSIGGGVEVREYGPTGRPEPDFAPASLGALGSLEGYTRVAIEGTGRILVATVEAFSGPSARDTVVHALLPDGSPDVSFGTGGVALAMASGWPAGLRLADTGTLVAFGGTWGATSDWWLSTLVAPAGPAAQVPLASTSRLVPVSPTRVLDTRIGTGVAGTARPSAGATVTLSLASAAPAPLAAVNAVVLNLTATDAAAPGYVTVWPTGGGRPTVSNLNIERAGQTVANLAVVPLGVGGSVSLFTQSGTHLVADVAGWFVASDVASAGRYVAATTPFRALDTRTGQGVAGSTSSPAAGGQVDLRVLGVGDVPATGVSAVAVNLTGTEAAAAGYVTVWPSGSARPVASALNLDAGGTRANFAIVPVGAGGSISLFTQSGTHLVVDIAGWFTDDSAPLGDTGLFVAIPPRRMLDTRITPGGVPPGGSITHRIGGTRVVPPASASAVVANITATESAGAGYVTVVAAGRALPVVSNLNLDRAGATVPNLAFVGLGGDAIRLYSQSGSHLIVDIAGWYT